MELTSPKNASKIHLYMERLLLKANFRLAEKLLYKPDCKKYSHRMWYEEKRNGVRICVDGKSYGIGGGLHRWRFSLGRDQFEPYTGH